MDQQLPGILDAIEKGNLPKVSFSKSLKILEKHECWESFEKLVRAQNTIEAWTELTRVQSLCLEDIEACIESLKHLIKSKNTSADFIINEMIPVITTHNDPQQQFKLLEGIWSEFTGTSDQIKCCETIATILDKQLRHSHQIDEIHRRLLDLDPWNIKALLFFKNVFKSCEQWEDLGEVCDRLLQIKLHPSELQRHAIEYAYTLIYHLDQPQKALEVLEIFAKHNSIDLTTLKFDAAKALGDWPKCLSLINETIAKTQNGFEISVMYFRKARVHDLANQVDFVYKAYSQAVAHKPDFFEAYEQWIIYALNHSNNEQIRLALKLLSNACDSPSYKQRISKMLQHISEGKNPQVPNHEQVV